MGEGRTPLRRHYRVALTGREEERLRAAPSDKATLDHLSGRARFRVRRDGTWRATIFRRWGAQQGVHAAVGDVRVVAPGEARVRVRSGGQVLGRTCAGVAVLFLLLPLLYLVPGDWIENPVAVPLGAGGMALVAWLLMARRFREPDLDELETFLRGRIGGRWEPVAPDPRAPDRTTDRSPS